jgi:hypothetical protein
MLTYLYKGNSGQNYMLDTLSVAKQVGVSFAVSSYRLYCKIDRLCDVKCFILRYVLPSFQNIKIF